MSQQTSFKIKLILAFASVYIIWGSTYLAILFGVQTIPPFIMAGTRHLVAGLILLFALRMRGPLERPTWFHWRTAAVMGFLMLLCGNGGVTWAEQQVPSGLTALLVATVPLWMGVLSRFGKGAERPGKREFAGIFLGLLGLGVLVGPENLAGDRPVGIIGAAVLMFAAFSWSAGSVYSKHAPHPSSPFLAAAMQMLCGGLCLIMLGFFTGEWTELKMENVSSPSALSLVYLIIFGSVIGFTAYIWLLKNTTPAKASTYAYVNPVVAVFFGWLLASEPLTPRILIAAIIIIGAVVMITLPKNITRLKIKKDHT